jgi:hypothetical protein
VGVDAGHSTSFSSVHLLFFLFIHDESSDDGAIKTAYSDRRLTGHTANMAHRNSGAQLYAWVWRGLSAFLLLYLRCGPHGWMELYYIPFPFLSFSSFLSSCVEGFFRSDTPFSFPYISTFFFFLLRTLARRRQDVLCLYDMIWDEEVQDGYT